MVDSQERLTLSNTDAVSRTAGMLVIGAVLALVFLKRLSVSVNL